MAQGQIWTLLESSPAQSSALSLIRGGFQASPGSPSVHVQLWFLLWLKVRAPGAMCTMWRSRRAPFVTLHAVGYQKWPNNSQVASLGFKLVQRVSVLPLAAFCSRLVSDTQAEATRISFAFRLACHEAKEHTVAHVVVRDFFMFFLSTSIQRAWKTRRRKGAGSTVRPGMRL